MSETGPVVSLAQFPPGTVPADEDENVRNALHDRPAGAAGRLPRRRRADARRARATARRRARSSCARPASRQGYFKKPAASEELWAGGYLHTQDVAVMTPDGYVQIVDRIKDVIKTGGEWVSSIEVEGLIAEVSGVHECAVIGVKDEKWGERPMAFVVGKPDATLTADGDPQASAGLRRGEPDQQVRRSRTRNASSSSPRSRRRASARSTRSCCANARPDHDGARVYPTP